MNTPNLQIPNVNNNSSVNESKIHTLTIEARKRIQNYKPVVFARNHKLLTGIAGFSLLVIFSSSVLLLTKSSNTEPTTDCPSAVNCTPIVGSGEEDKADKDASISVSSDDEATQDDESSSSNTGLTVNSSGQEQAASGNGSGGSNNPGSNNNQATVVFGPSMRPFSASSPWNTTTPISTTWYDTPVLHNLPDSTPAQWFVSFGSLAIYYADSSDPIWTFDMPDYIAASWNRNRPAEVFQRRGPSNLLDGGYVSGDTDHILTLVDVNTGEYVETWNTCVDTVNRIVQTGCGDPSHNGYPGWGRGNILSGNGAGTLTGANDGVRASNFSWIAGAITGRDIDNGYFDHALAISLPDYALAGAYAGLSSYRYPATAIDSGYASGPIFMGSKIGIPRSTPRPAGLSPLGNAMFDVLQNYGAYVGDFTGGPWPVIYTDQNTVSESDIAPLQQWNGGLWSQLAPLLRVADYQP